MPLGEVFLGAFLSLLLTQLTSPQFLNFVRREGIQKKMEKWHKMLLTIQAVLIDAEEKQLTDTVVKMWLEDLRDLAYDLEDVLDEFATEALRIDLTEETQGSTSKVRNPFSATFKSLSPSAIKFRTSMSSKIKEISIRLQDISDRRDKLGLAKNTGELPRNVWQRPHSTCVPSEPQVFGRDEDKRKILELMLRDEACEANFRVVPIVGMGGVGKTTLARLIYNDRVAVEDFNLKAWVSVSDAFDLVRITKAVLESITSNPCHLTEWNGLQVKLQEELAGKKFLLILDDVWNENYGAWDDLRSPFRAGAPGSRIIVTTRNREVAQMMGDGQYHQLEQISEDDCWLVFVMHAFENREDINAHPNLKTIGRKIVKKCGGLPLAARTLGGLLRSKRRDDEWEEVLNSKIWNLPDEKSDILPVLRLSYYHLPSHLKRCFSYCAIFPKDYEFMEEDVVLLWMAEGLIQNPEENVKREELGKMYFRDLLSISFFQQSSSDDSQYVMHDLISDLAQWAAGEDRLDRKRISRTRHLSYIGYFADDINKLMNFYDVKILRTFLPLMFSFLDFGFVNHSGLFHFLQELKCLRVFSLSGYRICELPSSIGKLKHLRYLDLSRTRIRSLPESVSILYNLGTLRLKNCLKLKKLPADIGNLVNLHYLNNSGTVSLEGMPLRIGKLTNLQTLSHFAAGKGSGSSLAELGPLSNLKGELCISRLENVIEAKNAMDADLISKKEVNSLLLKWNSQFDDSRNERTEMVVLDALQPHGELEKLTIKCYGGTKFSTWVGNLSFSNMTVLSLKDCKNCMCLPPLGLLPSLEDLKISGMSAIKYVGPEFYGDGISKPFPSLKTLIFRYMEGWVEWIPHGAEEFNGLRVLSIQKCPKLSGKLPSHLPLLEKLEIEECGQLVVSIPRLPILSELKINGCKEVDCRCSIDFGSLNTMLLSEISEFKCQTERFINGLAEVEHLHIGLGFVYGDDSCRRWTIRGCPLLVSLVAEDKEEQLQQGLSWKLETLGYNNLESLEKIPQLLHTLKSLRRLTIEDCPSLVSFPEDGLPSTLREISITNCGALAPLPGGVTHNSTCLDVLSIHGCDSLMSFGRHLLPPTLKSLKIRNCKNLRSLLDGGQYFYPSSSSSSMIQEENVINNCSLESLSIWDCESLSSISPRAELPASLRSLHIEKCSKLTSLSSGVKLPRGLKSLRIERCNNLDSTVEKFQDNMSLEEIIICYCKNIKSLPEDLHTLSNLLRIEIVRCEGFVSFPEEGLPTAKLRELHINGCKQLFDWGLQRLNSLKELWIYGGYNDVSFPLEETGMMLPSSLVQLHIIEFPNLKYLSSRGFQNLTSLESLSIYNCPKLTSFPKKGMPLSLLGLIIRKCPLLRERCKKDKGPEWPKIAHIRCVQIDGVFVYEEEY